MPSQSILAEPPAAVVDEVVDRHPGAREVATAYLNFLLARGQAIAAKHYYRAREASAVPAGQFQDIKLFTIDEAFGGWQKAQPAHFNDSGVFDQISAK